MRTWEEDYKTGELPWDTGVPDHHLVSLVNNGRIRAGATLEIGCGTGTNAIWLSNGGFRVLGIDIAPTAVEMARSKADGRSNLDFRCMDFLAEDLGSKFDFIFDRGTFHIFDSADERNSFVNRVAESLVPGGLWLSLIGSTEGPPRGHGPPRRNARDIVGALEDHLEIVELRTSEFEPDIPSSARAWICLARKRMEPAQISTRLH